MNNNNNNLYGAVIMLKAMWEFTWFMRWMQHGARWLPTFGPSWSA